MQEEEGPACARAALGDMLGRTLEEEGAMA